MKQLAQWWLVLLLLVVVGCGGAPIRGSSSASAGPGAPAAPAGAPAQETAAPDAERPGLGTAFGETRTSKSSSARFERDRDQPIAVGSLWYNDADGARSMAGNAGYRDEQRPVLSVLDGMVTVRIESDAGQVLPGFVADQRTYVIGQANERYSIVLQNHTGYRFEVVASVDGLDVIDGRPASFEKRGYILHPNKTLTIEGFRTSADAVAAFRFSSVRGSYAERSGQGDQNVGVVGVALFNERGVVPTWGTDDGERRKNANPFPASTYTQPPP